MRIANDTLISDYGVPEVVITNWESEPIWLGHISLYTIQLVYNAATSAVIKLQCSSDKGEPQSEKNTSYKIVNWTDIQGSATTVSGSGDGVFEVSEVPYNWVRVSVSGPITINSMRFNAKGV